MLFEALGQPQLCFLCVLRWEIKKIGNKVFMLTKTPTQGTIV